MEFNPEVEVGNFIEIVPTGIFGMWNCISFSSDWSDKVVEVVKKRLTEQYEGFVPEEYRQYVKFIIKAPVADNDPYSNTGTVGWMYTPKGYYDKDKRRR